MVRQIGRIPLIKPSPPNRTIEGNGENDTPGHRIFLYGTSIGSLMIVFPAQEYVAFGRRSSPCGESTTPYSSRTATDFLNFPRFHKSFFFSKYSKFVSVSAASLSVLI